MADLQAQGIAAGVVQKGPDLLSDPQLVARDSFATRSQRSTPTERARTFAGRTLHRSAYHRGWGQR
jgi:crotonobetainyl-CoA:carnitine CoA-transferase CaiB-like acyl-CoA transferase